MLFDHVSSIGASLISQHPGPDGKLHSVGNTVDVANATWTNTIGASELITVWSDPEFDPKLSAAYYARVLEIPTPRWTAYEAKRFEIDMKKEIPMITVERAITSPIWYTHVSACDQIVIDSKSVKAVFGSLAYRLVNGSRQRPDQGWIQTADVESGCPFRTGNT